MYGGMFLSFFIIIRSIYTEQLLYEYTLLRCDENKTRNSATLQTHNQNKNYSKFPEISASAVFIKTLKTATDEAFLCLVVDYSKALKLVPEKYTVYIKAEHDWVVIGSIMQTFDWMP